MTAPRGTDMGKIIILQPHDGIYRQGSQVVVKVIRWKEDRGPVLPIESKQHMLHVGHKEQSVTL